MVRVTVMVMVMVRVRAMVTVMVTVMVMVRVRAMVTVMVTVRVTVTVTVTVTVNMNLTKFLSDISDRLERATPGPWRTGSLESYNGVTGEPEAFVYRLPPGEDKETSHNRICIRGNDEIENGMDCDFDAALIASAPADLKLAVEIIQIMRGTFEYYAEEETLAKIDALLKGSGDGQD